ncbi:MAG: TnpV protein, partial [Eubacteriales bacterium]
DFQYTMLKMDGTLAEHLQHIDKQGKSMEETIVRQMMEKQGLTEETRLTDPKWEGKVNMIYLQAREIVQSELVFT